MKVKHNRKNDKWKTEIPEESGFYWVRTPGYPSTAEVVEIRDGKFWMVNYDRPTEPHIDVEFYHDKLLMPT
jgi:hypothetical protein